MNSEVGSDKEELKKPFHVLHEKDFEDEDRAFFCMTRRKGYESKQRGPVLRLRTLGQDSARELVWPEGLINCKNYSQTDDTKALSWRRSLSSCTVDGWSWKLSSLQYVRVCVHIYVHQGDVNNVQQRCELHLCLCCQYTWQWPGVTQSFHPSGPSTPRWVNYLAAEPGKMQKPAELDQKFQPRFHNVQSRRQMFHASWQRTARFAASSPEFTAALR